MRASKPPAAATWMLKHLAPGGENEALTGDLLEEFSRGRSATWYWRQVVVAILVGFGKELHILRVAAGFTIVWSLSFVLAASGQKLDYTITYASDAVGWLEWTFRSPLQSVFGWGVPLAWPFSGLFLFAIDTALNTVPLLVLLTSYLLVRRSLRLRLLAQGFLRGLIGFLLGFIAWMVLPSDDLIVGSLPLFFALLLSIWSVRPDNASRRAAKISD